MCNCYCSNRWTHKHIQTTSDFERDHSFDPKRTPQAHLEQAAVTHSQSFNLTSLLCLINCASLIISSGFRFHPILTVVTNFITETLGSQRQHPRTKKDQQNLETKFRLYTDATEEGCQIFLNQLETLDKCSFNASLPLVMIVHGWSV